VVIDKKSADDAGTSRATPCRWSPGRPQRLTLTGTLKFGTADSARRDLAAFTPGPRSVLGTPGQFDRSM
jgi:hypothetical protein